MCHSKSSTYTILCFCLFKRVAQFIIMDPNLRGPTHPSTRSGGLRALVSSYGVLRTYAMHVTTIPHLCSPRLMDHKRLVLLFKIRRVGARRAEGFTSYRRLAGIAVTFIRFSFEGFKLKIVQHNKGYNSKKYCYLSFIRVVISTMDKNLFDTSRNRIVYINRYRY